MTRITAKEYRKLTKRRTRSKYGNKKVKIDGYTFDSKAEALFYSELKIRQKTGEILFFRVQPRYRLLDGFEKDGKKHRPIDYIADFEIHHKDGSIEVVDVKGAPPTQVFRIKEKLFNAKYPHKLTLVKLEKGRFVEV